MSRDVARPFPSPEEQIPLKETQSGTPKETPLRRKNDRITEAAQEAAEKARGIGTGQALFKDTAQLFDSFEVTNIMTEKKFSPRELSDGTAPDDVEKAFEDIKAKYRVANIDELFNLIKTKYSEFKKANRDQLFDEENLTAQVKDELSVFKKLDMLRDKWELKTASTDIKKRQEINTQAREAARIGYETTKAKQASELMDDMANLNFVKKLKPRDLADISAERQQELLASSTRLAKQEGKEGLAGAEMYQKLDRLGITPKTARVSNVMARFRDRAAEIDIRAGVGIVGGGEIAENRSSLINSLERPKIMFTHGSAGEMEKPVKQEGGLRNFWRKITGNYEIAPEPQSQPATKKPNIFRKWLESLKGNKETEEQKMDKKREAIFKNKYQKSVLELKNMGTNFAKASLVAKISEAEINLAIDILTGKVIEPTEAQKKMIKSSLEKASQFSNELNENKARAKLFELYKNAAEEIGALYEIGHTAAERLNARRNSSMASIGNPKEGWSSGKTPTL